MLSRKKQKAKRQILNERSASRVPVHHMEELEYVHNLGYNVVISLKPLYFGAIGYLMMCRTIAHWAHCRQSIAKANRRASAMRLGKKAKKANAREVNNESALDTLLNERIDAGYHYEKNASKDKGTYVKPPNRQHTGQKKARLASRIDTRKVTVRSWDKRAFNPENGEFGMWSERVSPKPQLSPIQNMVLDGVQVSPTITNASADVQIQATLNVELVHEAKKMRQSKNNAKNESSDFQLPLFLDFVMRTISHFHE